MPTGAKASTAAAPTNAKTLQKLTEKFISQIETKWELAVTDVAALTSADYWIFLVRRTTKLLE